MIIVPDSDIILIKSPLKLDNYNQITFANATAQYNYFSSLPKLEYDGCTYQRKDGVIRYSTDKESDANAPRFEDLLQYNYCMYKNDSYKDKWFYAFITDINYINDGMSEITIDTDAFQTWQFDINYMNSFIEREHVSNDTIGLHTIPENVELGEFIINSVEEIDERANDLFICMGLSRYPSNIPLDSNDRVYGKIYSGLLYLLFDSASDCSKMIKAMDKLGYADDIFTIFTIPTSLSFSNNWWTGDLGNQQNIKFAIAKTSNEATSMVANKDITINTSIDSYIPKNNKLFTYPYNYLYITNNSGNDTIFKYEDFTNNTPKFNVDGIISTGCSIKLYPLNYKKADTSVWKTKCYNYGMIGNKYPTCSWKSDSYTNWLTQNSVNLALDTASNLIGAGVAAKEKDAMAMTNSIMGIANSIAQVYNAHFIPNQAKGNTNGGDITCSNEMMGFTAYKMSVRNEYAKIIDDYFTMYGYKVNRLATPNIHKRSNWDFIKCIDVNLEGNIPEKDLTKIRDLFNNGCTFWHTTSNFLDYSQTNSIL